MRTRLSVCRRKRRFASAAAAMAQTEEDGLPLLPYRCDRCERFHLTHRAKGKFPARKCGKGNPALCESG